MNMKRVIFSIVIAAIISSVELISNVVPALVGQNTRIVGGSPAAYGEFPGQVSLQNELGMHVCGGTLIDGRSIMTAGHCYKPTEPITLVMGGDISITTENTGADRQVRNVQALVIHPKFNDTSLINDLAYIRVDRPFNITKGFHPMRRSKKSPTVGDICTVCGWGFTEYSEDDELSEDLMKVDVEVFDTNFCNGSNSYFSLMQEGMFCAGDTGGGKDSCQGDSGGFISCGTDVVSGVVSFGVGCGAPNYPGVYTDVSLPFYAEWIDNLLVVDNFTQYFIDNEPEAIPSLTTISSIPTNSTTDTGNATVVDNNSGTLGMPKHNAYYLIMAVVCGVLCNFVI